MSPTSGLRLSLTLNFCPGFGRRGRLRPIRSTYSCTCVDEVGTKGVLAIACDDGDRAAQIIQDALGIESDDVANYCFPKDRPEDREQRARIIGEWRQMWPCYINMD